MIVIAKSRSGQMVKVGENEADSKWYGLSTKVATFVKTGIEIGDKVTIKSEEDAGKNIITFISKDSKTTTTKKYIPTKSTPPPTEEPPTGFICSECGVALKDNKYSTCYACSLKLKDKVNKSPEEHDKQDSIKRQAVAHATSRVLISLQGHIDPNNVNTIFNTIYDNILKKVNG